MGLLDEIIEHYEEVTGTLSKGKAGDRARGLLTALEDGTIEAVETNFPFMLEDPQSEEYVQSVLDSGLGMGGVGGVTRTVHGSVHKFDEFGDHALGSGTGAQVYGPGHYTGTNPDYIDNKYRFEQLTQGGDQGYMYLTELAQNPEDYIAYNTILAHQDPEVLNKLFEKYPGFMEDMIARNSMMDGQMVGKDLVTYLRETMPGNVGPLSRGEKLILDHQSPEQQLKTLAAGKKQAQEREMADDLLQIDIPGFRFADPHGKNLLSNYVTTDPKSISIIDRIPAGLENPDFNKTMKIITHPDQTPY